MRSSAVCLHIKLFVYNFRLFGLCLLCLLPSTGPSWWPAISALPFAIWYLKRLYKVPTGNSGLYEPTEIRQRLFLRFSIRETIAFLVFHSLAFFGLLFALAATLSLTEEVPWWKIRQKFVKMVKFNAQNLENIRVALKASLSIIQRYQWLIDLYVLDFFVDNHWSSISSNWRTFIGNVQLYFD